MTIKRFSIILFVFLIQFLLVSSVFAQSTDTNWPMSGHDPERTSWTPEEVRGPLKPLWYRVVDPYISRKIQIIAANNMLYVATSKGLVALNPDTGATNWTYPTELPLGNSPTFVNGILYVPGLDKMVHAVNATTGTKLWTSVPTDAGFQTNPVVINNKVYLGNRDGYFYAFNTSDGSVAWKFKTDGAILYSAAYKNGTLYFASQDSYAYAINEQGQQLWKTKLTGAGFHSWWPVIYQNRVIFSGSPNYRNRMGPGDIGQLSYTYHLGLWPSSWNPSDTTISGYTPIGNVSFSVAGNWVAGTRVINAQTILDYFAAKPYRKLYFVLDQATGQEKEQAPVSFFGTQSGNRFPPMVSGFDNVIYQGTEYYWGGWIGSGHVSGWKLGTPYISVITNDWGPVDEPGAWSGGGRMLYRNHILAREVAGIDLSMPMSCDPAADKNGCQSATREWWYMGYNINTQLPNALSNHYIDTALGDNPDVWSVFGNKNGVYGDHGDTNPLVPYKGKLYARELNSIVAFSPTTSAVQNPANISLPPPTPFSSTADTAMLKTKLEAEISKMIAAGHLRPGFISSGNADPGISSCGMNLLDYWHNPGETVYSLVRAYPYVSSTLQQQIKTYLNDNYIRDDVNGIVSFPVWKYGHIGWKNGTSREAFTLPPEVSADMVNRNPDSYWYEPFSFYAMWQFVKVIGNSSQTMAKDLFDKSKSKMPALPSDTELIKRPNQFNAYLAGYLGYLELEKLAGYSETTSMRSTYNRLLALRSSSFSKDSTVPAGDHGVLDCMALNVANNFMFLVPEVSASLRTNILPKIQQAVSEYEYLAPYWFIPSAQEGFGEGTTVQLYDRWAMFQAKAQIVKESAGQLVKYLDAPVVAIGDLYYIQNLASVIEATGGVTTTPTPTAACGLSGDLNCSGKVDSADLLILLGNFGKSGVGDINNSGKVDSADLLILLGNFGK